MSNPSEAEILKRIKDINVNIETINRQNNLAAVGNVSYAKITSSRFIFTIKTTMKKVIKSVMYFVYKIIKKPLNTFLRIVDPSIYQSNQEVELLRSENKLLKQKLENAK